MKAPWHIWLVGIVVLLWNAMGALDYVMTKIRYEPYLAQLTAEQRAFFDGFPLWVTAAWAIAVWGAVLAAILLLLRRRAAVGMFALALVAMLVTALHNFVLATPNMTSIVGTGALIFSAAIAVVAFLEWAYALWLARRGVLV